MLYCVALSVIYHIISYYYYVLPGYFSNPLRYGVVAAVVAAVVVNHSDDLITCSGRV